MVTRKVEGGNPVIRARWCTGGKYYKNNWGDALTPWLIEAITGERPVLAPRRKQTAPHFLCVGSILGWADSGSTVWGTGFMSPESKYREQPHKVCAVRGPLTRDMLLREGCDCPEVYGDPGLLMPRFYKPDAQKKFRLGVIPHYVDQKHPWVERARHLKDVRVINILGGITAVVDAVVSCEAIVSSSLHGLVVADAYGVPNVWVKLSERVRGKGFKFRDYYAAQGLSDVQPLVPTNVGKELSDRRSWDRRLSLDALWDACPFRKDKR